MTVNTDLFGRSQQVIEDARALCAASTRLVSASTHARTWAHELRGVSMRLRQRKVPAGPPRRPARGEPTAFTIRGMIDGAVATARWDPAGGLACPPELLARAEIVVAMGEQFGGGRGRPALRASFDDGPIALLLTITRAFTQVLAVDVVVPSARSRVGRANDDHGGSDDG